jgi:small subunit ribosomal protein S17
MQKTVVVKVERKFRHPLYRKIIIRHKKYKAHNEKLELVIGDKVKIEETRPISKDKHFNVIEKLDD